MSESSAVLVSKEVIKANKAILRKFWENKIRTVWSAYSCENQYRQMEDHNLMISEAAENLKKCATIPGIIVPRFTIDFGTISTASFWGGKIRRGTLGNPWIDTVVHEPGDVPGMKHIDPCKGHTEEAGRLYDRLCELIGDHELPASTFDLQGPLNTLSLIWDQDNMMVSMYENPDSLHEALSKVTQLLVRNIECLYRRIPNIEAPLWPFIWLPPDIGIGITEDYMPLLSPELYREFGLPYVKILSDRFKGLFIHCCGEFTHQIDNLCNSDINIIGMEFAYPKVDIDKLFEAFKDTCVFVPNIMDNHIDDFGSFTDFMLFIEKKRRPETRIWYLLRPDLPDFDEQVKLMESLNEV